jgi:hypothetical protein
LNLIQLGWHQALGAQAAFAPLAEAGFCVGRIAQEQRHRYQVYTADGELPAEVTGHLRHHTEQLEDFPTVGDWVALQLQGHAPPPEFTSAYPALVNLSARWRALKPQARWWRPMSTRYF